MKNRLLSFTMVFILFLSLDIGGSQAGDIGNNVEPQAPIGQGFTYQGKLNDNDGNPISGSCDFRFILYDAEIGGAQIGPIQDKSAEYVMNGYFTVTLDFGDSIFSGEARWLEVSVRCPAGSGEFTSLSPRQQLTPTPYAVYASNAATVPWSGISGTPGLWMIGGNSGLEAGEGILGTTDNISLTLVVNNSATLRLEPNQYGPNIIGGYSENWITSGVMGVTLFGGGLVNDYSSPNRVTDAFGTVSGGLNNQAGNNDGDIANTIGATVGGGINNSANGYRSTIGGGESNSASESATTISGGSHNSASGYQSTISGGFANSASGPESTISGGEFNTASGPYGTISGGATNSASGIMSTIGGGVDNSASTWYSTIGGGSDNNASGDWSTIGGGWNNSASGERSIVGGGCDNLASGFSSTIPGGYGNTAVGNYSFAAGHNAIANNNGCFVWGDAYSVDITCDVENQWIARTSGGVYFYTNSDLTSGVYVAAGGSSWNAVSNPLLKSNLESVDTQKLVSHLADIPITTWNYKSQDESIRHVGPMADDFNALLPGLGGEGEMYINSLDADGIALASIQGLYQIIQDKTVHITELEARVTALEAARGTNTSAVCQPHINLNTLLPGLFGLLGVAAGVFISRKREGFL